MKSLIILSLLASWAVASEYVSIQPNKLVESLATKAVKAGARLDYSSTLSQYKFTKDAANLQSYESNPSTFNPQTWYTPNGWHSIKAYFPAGLKSASLSFSTKPNAALRIHVTYRADGKVIDHTSSVIDENEFVAIADTRTHAYQADSLLAIELSPAFIDSTNGGWVYIDIVEDSMNQGSYYGDVNPDVGIGMSAIVGDVSRFNAWKNSVAVDALGNPGDEMATLTVIDKTGATTTATRTIVMDPAVNPNADEDKDGTINKNDCAMFNPAIHPGATDIPNNGIDEDCDGSDRVDLTILDADNDGEMADVDCDDSNKLINSSAIDIPNNGIDEDCSGSDLIDPNADYDQDGEKASVDCNDYDAKINTSATDIPNNGIDEDCKDGDLVNLKILDRDKDGYMADVDCDDNNKYIHPGATEIAGNGIDEDCKDGDGIKTVCNFWEDCYVDPNPSPTVTPKDNDNDGYNDDVDCNDYNPNIHPDAVEIAGNGIDEDCKDGDAKLKPADVAYDLRKEAQDAADAVSGKVFTFQGVFSQHRFFEADDKQYLNWVYLDLKDKKIYQLLANPSTPDDVFGWVERDDINTSSLERNWYMFTADIDGDNEQGRFEWIVVSADPKENRAYKLAGANDKGTFLYSDKMPVRYKLVNNQVIEFE